MAKIKVCDICGCELSQRNDNTYKISDLLDTNVCYFDACKNCIDKIVSDIQTKSSNVKDVLLKSAAQNLDKD